MNIFEEQISRSLLRLRTRAPFFATLALFAPVQASGEIPTAATDGRTILVNPQYLSQLDPAQQDAVLLHAVLHAALLHVSRRGARDEMIWNMAADIVVNGMIAKQANLDLPPDSTRDPSLEHLSVEEIYEILQFSPERQPPFAGLDLLNNLVAGSPGDRSGGAGQEAGAFSSQQVADLESHWQNALQQAQMIAETQQSAGLPVGVQREIGAVQYGQIDWRAQLWRYLVQTPTDFAGFDRRFVGRGLYLEALEGESIRVYVAVDTSGSVNDAQARALVGEVQSILGTYPHIRCDLYYADDRLYGPYPLDASSLIPSPIGGGGTDFEPFFSAIEQRRSPFESALAIYLTDGMGLMPRRAPDMPVLWVVTPGGRATEDFDFGEVTRLLEHR